MRWRIAVAALILTTRLALAADGPWTAECAYFAQPPSETWCKPAGDVHYKFLIATAPDPEMTHLALDLDRSLESILWAAQDEGWSFSRYWLPWEPEPAKE